MSVFSNGTATFNSVAVAEVTGFKFDVTGERITHSADVDTFLSAQALVKRDRTAEVHTDDISDAFGYKAQHGTSATLSCVAKSADGGSDVTLSGSFMLIGISGGVAHATLDNDQTLSFAAVSTDGTTDPLTVS